MKTPLHFSHANSFPASSYKQFLSQFEADFDVGYIEALGHDPRYPVHDCWPNQVLESIRYIEQRYDQPVIAVGHSLGGFLSFMCAMERPDLFRAVVLLDSPIFSRRVSSMLRLGKWFGFIERLTPGRGSRTRRREWPSTEAAYRHFEGRGMFADFDPRCLRDYVMEGTVPTENGVRLKFDTEVEYRIYVGLPHVFPRHRGKLTVPTGFIGGKTSIYVRPADIASMKRHFGVKLAEFDGGHLFPFEKPELAAVAVKEMIAALTTPAG
ncbi:alpha/beta hydrolase [Chitinimonas viridis]|uniref:Alpha/beta hydrolase n=1 Tax=Chitinimonas viridis TaxID=664880 RepID=A0ABT8BAM4_9NEIS|nr:alpha/beta hydrolase [Chitinimonas viridis]MDN3579094.1 alpha/beta hydrolase [Chitinimonas viridis]